MPLDNELSVREATEIRRARDLLVAVLARHIPTSLPDEDFPYLNACVSALCWVIGDERSTSFARNMATIETDMAQMGYALGRRPNVHVH
jgi:hypothetical protein